MSKIRQAARGQQCQVRIPMYCNHNPETVVLAHMNGGGMGMKHPDRKGAFCCSVCHDIVDGRLTTGYTSEEIKLMHLEGILRTHDILEEMGLLKCV